MIKYLLRNRAEKNEGRQIHIKPFCLSNVYASKEMEKIFSAEDMNFALPGEEDSLKKLQRD